MKRIIPLILVLFILFSLACSSEQPQIKLSSPEAFAYTLEEGWELNATVIATGFQQNEEGSNYTAKLSYTMDLITPTDSIANVDLGNIEEVNEEEPFTDIMIESQIELNSEFPVGDYKIIFYVTDDLSNTKDTAFTKFKLSID